MVAKILIVDDEKMICEEFRDLLQEDSHEVDIALSGKEAILKVQENEYDLIFLDVLMPQMEGREVLERIRKMSKASIVIMSGYMPPHKEKETLALGAIACLRKPLDWERVRNLLRSVEPKKNS